MRVSESEDFNMKKAKIINNLLLLIGSIIFAVSAFELFRVYWEYKQGKDKYDEILGQSVEILEPDETEPGVSESFWYSDVAMDFDYLQSVNEEITGWLRFDHNGIDYPVVQGDNNDKYLYTMADGTKNKCGSIFIEALCEPDFNDSHTIIYGHNMKDQSMFGALKKYKSEEDYYKDNSYFTIYTVDMAYRYQIFAYYDVEETDSLYQVGFAADNTFGDFVNMMSERSYKDTDVTAGLEDKVVTLSTCSAEGKRFVVNAKQIESYKFH